ncbi:MAG: hypothetical protein L6R40_005937 [Gallowayella cf. fulva]|nr:MAG: hypothetical protein L6R40_005937 [Xanthomendoza cf. fulva]
MPSTKQQGTAGPANKIIGGIPTIHYLDFASRGRGQVVRLMWEDAGIAYEDIRYSFEEYPEYKKSIIAEKNPTATVPIVELNGKILTRSYAILRHFARQLGKYEGETEEEKYWADAMCDIAIDWRTLFIAAFFNPNKEQTYPKHQDTDRNHALKALETHLTSHELSKQGPYVIEKTFTYADMVIYQVLHDENLTQEGRKGLQDYPRLKQLVDAVETRPNVKAFLESDRYLG